MAPGPPPVGVPAKIIIFFVCSIFLINRLKPSGKRVSAEIVDT